LVGAENGFGVWDVRVSVSACLQVDTILPCSCPVLPEIGAMNIEGRQARRRNPVGKGPGERLWTVLRVRNGGIRTRVCELDARTFAIAWNLDQSSPFGTVLFGVVFGPFVSSERDGFGVTLYTETVGNATVVRGGQVGSRCGLLSVLVVELAEAGCHE
jgi:hypothetical protein